ncbi:unnamed protein product [Cylindrotheca closterium]|uniref:Uncharacterized protein n=1 Tax=Cylindrotheca closterium TaxID=2856 RepID=A0AAD2G2A5_9STRA|nr:unnamed protein product [Cylindrotheca closterium]
MGEEKKSSKSSRSRDEEDKEAKRKARQSRSATRGDRSPVRSSRRPDQDKEAKDRARRDRSHGTSAGHSSSSSGDRESKRRAKGSSRAATPGVQSMTSGEENRESRKARRETANHGHRSPHRSPNRSSSRTGSSSADQEAKRRARHGSRPAAGPGVVGNSIPEESAPPQPRVGEEDIPAALAIEAETVEDDNDQKQEVERQVQQRMAAMTQQQQQQQPQQRPYQPKPPNFAGASPDTEENNGEPEEPPAKSKWKCIVLVVVLIAIAGGVGAFFALRPAAKEPVAVQEEPIDGVDNGGSGPSDETASPVVEATETPTQAPIIAVTTSPTAEPLAFPPPEESDCEAVRQREDVVDQETLESRTFDIGLDVELSIDMPLSEWQGALIDQMESSFVPLLVGCDDAAGTSRYLKGGGDRRRRRRRRLNSLRYLIANAKIEAREETDEECNTQPAAGTCKRIYIFHEFFIKDSDAKSFELIGVYTAAIEEAGTLLDVLGLSDPPFSAITVTRFNNLQPTTAPSVAPSAEPTVAGSQVPSQIPSKDPTGMPSPSPSTVPSVSPSAGPTQTPTLQATPGPTPPPTPGPTQPPTPPPTPGPTQPPTPPPTVAPTPPPTKEPTLAPSAIPSSTPSLMPVTPRPSPGVPFHCSTQRNSCPPNGAGLEEIYVEMTESEASVFIDYCPNAQNPQDFAWSVIIRTKVGVDFVNLFVDFLPSAPTTIDILYEQDTCVGNPCNGNCFGNPCSGSYGTYAVGGSTLYTKSVTIAINSQVNVPNTGFSYAFSDGFTRVTSPGIGQYYQLISCG